MGCERVSVGIPHICIIVWSVVSLGIYGTRMESAERKNGSVVELH